MRNNIYNPFGLFQQHLRTLDPSSYYFMPLHGLGDRSTFYALLGAFEQQFQASAVVLYPEGEKDPLLELFPDVNKKARPVPAGILIPPLKLTHWVYGAPTPTPGQVYFTWHQSHADGRQAHAWASSTDGGWCSHKTQVKGILGLPYQVQPQAILSEHMGATTQNVYIAPVANSTEFDFDRYHRIALRLRSIGVDPIWNIDQHAFTRLNAQQQMQLAAFRVFSGAIPDFLRLAKQAKLTISVRSGICELLSLAQANYAIVNSSDLPTFWHLNDWGKAPHFSAPALQDENLTWQAILALL